VATRDGSTTELDEQSVRALAANLPGGLYLNFPGFGEEGESLVRASVGNANYERLPAIKARYDPTNLFSLNMNVKPRT
jgi:FAD/FMN-containing dehydrogenase